MGAIYGKWTVKDGKVDQTGMMSVKAINEVIKKY